MKTEWDEIKKCFCVKPLTEGHILKALAKLLMLSYMEEVPNEKELESWRELVCLAREEYDMILKQIYEQRR